MRAPLEELVSLEFPFESLDALCVEPAPAEDEDGFRMDLSIQRDAGH